MNLPQNGPLWSKLRDGSQIKFSPSANRSTHLEELINRMMAPEPDMRPSIDEILLHPNLSQYMNNRFTVSKTTSLPMDYLPRHQNFGGLGNDENCHPNTNQVFNSEAKYKQSDVSLA